MRILILSDLHSNGTALDAVLDVAKDHWDVSVCLGDVVGYGPDPNYVTARLQELGTTTIRGNHDKVALGVEILEWFNPVAKTAALWTLNELTPENRQYVRQLPRGPLAVDGFQIVHGSPLDEDEYPTAASARAVA